MQSNQERIININVDIDQNETEVIAMKKLLEVISDKKDQQEPVVNYIKKWSKTKGKYLESRKLNSRILEKRIYYKVMSHGLENRGFKYELDDISVLQGTLDPDPTNLSDGLYFCNLSKVYKWFHLYPCGVVCEVYVPKDATVYRQKHKYKANKIRISNPLSFEEFTLKHKLSKTVVMRGKLRYFDPMNHDTIIIDAIQNGLAITYLDVKLPNYDMYIKMAYDCSPEAKEISYLHNEVLLDNNILNLLADDGSNIKYIDKDVPNYDSYVFIILDKDDSNIKYIDKDVPNYDSYVMKALKTRGSNIKHIDKDSLNYDLYVNFILDRNKTNIKYINKDVPNYDSYAVKALGILGTNIRFIDPDTSNYRTYVIKALEINGSNIKYIDKNIVDFESYANIALDISGFNIKYIDKSMPYYAPCVIRAVKQNGKVLKSFTHTQLCAIMTESEVEDLYITALKKNKKSAKYIDCIQLASILLNKL